MTPEQIDDAIEELSVRLERVRSLYEQYFMGIERLEPSIPRKDVERRLFELRKTRFQNTAKRFKFQTIVQRYNSLQQYWYRTCRDIENGTYRKHVLRAERRFGKVNDAAARDEGVQKDEQDGARDDERARERERAVRDMENLLDVDVDLDAEWQKAIGEAEASKNALSKSSTTDRATDQRAMAEGAADQRAAASPGGGSQMRAAGKLALPALDKGPHAPPSRVSSNSILSSLKELGDLHERPSLASVLRAGPRPQGLGTLASSPHPKQAGDGPKVSPRPVVLRQSSRPPPPLDPPQVEAPTAARAAPTERAVTAVQPRTAAGTPPAGRASPPRTEATAAAASAPRERMKTLPGAGESLGGASRASAPVVRGAANRPRGPATSSSPGYVAQPEGPSVALSDERIRMLHAKYSEARKQTQATSVSFEKLSQSIRETEQKLRAQHAGRQVDFDVTIKDGKAILKPKLK